MERLSIQLCECNDKQASVDCQSDYNVRYSSTHSMFSLICLTSLLQTGTKHFNVASKTDILHLKSVT